MRKLGLIVLSLFLLFSVAKGATVLFPIGGGLGTSTAPVSGQVPIGNSGNTYSPAYLTAGSNITVTTSSGGISIAASGGGGGGIATSALGIYTPGNLTFFLNSSTVSASSALTFTSSTGLFESSLASTTQLYAPSSTLTTINGTPTVTSRMGIGAAADANSVLNLNRAGTGDGDMLYLKNGSNGVHLTLGETNGTNAYIFSGTNMPLLLGANGATKYTINTNGVLASAIVPPQAATTSLINLSATNINGGNVSGTYIGANAASGYNGDFLNLQVASTSNFKVTGVGAVTIASTTTLMGNVSTTIVSAIVLANSSGVLGAYGGASACASGNFVTTISAVGASTCGTLVAGNFANPSASVGLVANNGSATTAMRSDASPALSQSIIPTWSGLHVFTGGATFNSTSTHNSSTIMVATTTIGTSTATSTSILNVFGNLSVNDINGNNGVLIKATSTDTNIFQVNVSGSSTSAFSVQSSTGIVGIDMGVTSASIGGGSLAAGACASTSVAYPNTATSTGIVIATPQVYPGDSSYWKAYISAPGTAVVLICEAVIGTPVASTYNLKYIR